MNFEFSAIGKAITPYQEKFSIPRQPGLVTADDSYIELIGHANREEILRGLEGFSHIWLVFVFHQAIREDWKPMVRPPRLGGNEKVGVFASRSPFRPNPIGLSAVEITEIKQAGKHWHIHIKGADLVNGTPIIDIKPYLPYSDSIEQAQGGFAKTSPCTQQHLSFSGESKRQLDNLKIKHPNLEALIEQILKQQPEPAYHNSLDRTYGMSLYDLNITWRYVNNHEIINVLSIDSA